MGNGNSNPTLAVMQQIALETHQIHQMSNKIGTMSAEQTQMLESMTKMLNGMNNIFDNLTGLSMLLNCMQIAQLETMNEHVRGEILEVYQDLCKKYGVKPLTGEIILPNEENEE